jgi:hypothetical protein
MKAKKFHPKSSYSLKLMGTWVGVFAIIGVTTLLLTRAATPGIPVTVDSTLPNPTSVKAYADDRTATITWTPPSNASSKGIIGYYVTWGDQSKGVYTNAKQTEFNETQIQPLENGKAYNVKVQSVHGSFITVSVTGAHADANQNPREGRASGKVSPGTTATVTPSSAKVDQYRQQMTGFFDDFNTPAGAFDELKWNTAQSACVALGKGGTFVNNQFHGHTQVRSECDRAQIVNRARALFDITGRTESNPGVIVGDFDGTDNGRDAWYIDLIPTNARKSGVPLDITSHASVFDDEPADPSMLRIEQLADKLAVIYYDANKSPHFITPTYSCPDWGSPFSIFEACSKTDQNSVPSLSPLPFFTTTAGCPEWSTTCLNTISNLRRNWQVQLSDTKIKVFIEGVRFWEGPMPSIIAQHKKFVVQNNLFSYNTGKGDDEGPTTAMLHWDNFGFNGPAPSTVVHNYLDGGPNGTTPYLGLGTIAMPLPAAPRKDKINIPDPIGSPVQSRVMFTFNNSGPANYIWSSSDHIMVNGKRYNLPNPALSQQTPILKEWDGNDQIGSSYVPYADSIIINAADLKTGMNDIEFNIGAEVRYMGLLNAHLELEYTKGTEPSYTQPIDIFGRSAFMAAYQPAMTSHDSYIFIEQDFGLPSGALDSTTPVDPPAGSDTTKPTVSLTNPADNTTVSGSSVNATAAASDNIGVSKVEFYIGNILKTTDTSSPYSASLSTTGLAPGSYQVTAVAYDAANNTTTSNSRTIIIPTPPDTTAPQVSIIVPTANSTISGSSTNVQASASDNVSVTKVEFYIDNNLISTDTTEPYAAILDSTKQTNGAHTLLARAFDAAGNSAPSSNVSINVSNTTADTTQPTVSISAPTANATISGSLAFIQATASDNVAVTKVEFYMDGTLLGTDTSSPYSFSLNTTLYPNGTHSLTAKAFDSSNNSKVSSAVTITINNVIADTTPPSVILVTPASGTTISGTYNISATAADANGVAKVEFLVDGSVKATDTSSPYSYSFDTKSVANGSHTISAKAYDTAGNSQPATAAVTVNNTASTVLSCDFNNDGAVGIQDLVILVSNYGKTVTAGTGGDCTNDGKVGIQDLVTLIGQYGS